MFKSTLLLIIFLNITCISIGQSKKIDKLYNQMQEYSKAGESRNVINTVFELKEQYRKKKVIDSLAFLLYDLNLARHYNNLGEYSNTTEIYEKYLNCKICQEDTLISLYAELNDCQVESLKYFGKFEQALYLNNYIIQLTEKFPDWIGSDFFVRLLNDKGIILRELGRFDEAEKMFDTVIISEKYLYSDLSILIEAIKEKSFLFEIKADYPKAIESTLKLIDVYETNKDSLLQIGHHRLGYCNNFAQLSNYYLEMYDFENAILFAKKALEMNEKLGNDDISLALSSLQLADCYLNVGNYSETEKFDENAIKLYEKKYGKNSPDLLLPLSKYALDLMKIDISKSYLICMKAIKIIEKSKINFQETSTLYHYLAMIYYSPDFSNKNLDSSIYYALLSQSTAKKISGENSVDFMSSLDLLSTCYFMNNNYFLAIENQEKYKELVEIKFGKNHQYYYSAIINLSTEYKYLKQYKKSEFYALEAIEWWRTYIKKNYISIVGNLHKNTKILEAFENFNLFILDNFPYLKKQEIFIAAYENQLLLKNIQLANISSLRDEAANDSVLQRKLEKYFQLISKNSTTETELQINLLESELFTISPAFKLLQEGKNTTTKEISDRLKPGEVSIEFSRFYDPQRSDYSYVALVLTPLNPTPFITWIGTEDSIDLAIKNRDMISLYKNIWSTIPKILPLDTKTIYLSPVYSLNNVPFHSLCDSRSNVSINLQSSLQRGLKEEKITSNYGCTYLMDIYDIHILSSTRSLIDKKNPIVSIKPIVMTIGAVDYNEVTINNKNNKTEVDLNFYNSLSKENRAITNEEETFQYLEGTKIEVDKISTLLKKSGWPEIKKTGPNASENELKNILITKQIEIVHFATHGFAFPDKELGSNEKYTNNEDPLNRCGLVLAGGNKTWQGKNEEMINKYGEDGILTGKEVENLSLNKTKLVVLSACKTGIGKIEGIEGSFSLNRAFLLAGVDYVISSLWSVPDKETTELMNFFYDQLIITRNIELSFEHARLKMRKLYPNNPSVWASFVLVL